MAAGAQNKDEVENVLPSTGQAKIDPALKDSNREAIHERRPEFN